MKREVCSPSTMSRLVGGCFNSQKRYANNSLLLNPVVLSSMISVHGTSSQCGWVQPSSNIPTLSLSFSLVRNQAFKISHAKQLRRKTRGSVLGRLICCASQAPLPQELMVAEPGKTKIGFLGMGIMGVPMALNLIKAGFDLTVWNRTLDKCNVAAAAGAQIASSPAEVASECDIIVAMVSDPEACLKIAKGNDGVIQGLRAGKGYIDVSTVDAQTAKQVAACVRAEGAFYLEAPVSGSKGPAEQGQLIFLTGGDEQLFHAATPLLDVMGKASFFLGDVGSGANMKLVVNMVMGTMMTAFAEGLSLAEGSGLKKDDLIEVIKLGAIAAPMFALKGPTMSKRSYSPAFPLKHQQKDMRLALALGDELGQALPTAAAANQLYKQAQGSGLGDSDFSAVLEAVATQRH